MSLPSLGPFELVRPIDAGGMAVVWEGRHPPTRARAAIKVLNADRADDSHKVTAIEAEIRAVAALDHPNIVWIYDAGRVPHGFEILNIASGHPWFAMEYLAGGTLHHRMRRLDWATICRIVIDLLAALAHAHARGLLHRDVKPSNILFRTRASTRPVLADFGMAGSPGATWASTPGGTPAWMAPEQILDDLPAQGPWTDLYALGCLVWAMVCGRRPYRGTALEVARAQLYEPLPPLEAVMQVPAELADWLARMTAKDPAERFQRAADAANAFRTFVDVDPDTLELGWRQSSLGHRHVDGAGLGLFGLRERALVGRAEQRRALWEHLLAVHRSGPCRAVVLHGPSGAGRTRLARWLARRAHERGLATTFEVRLGPDGNQEALVDMIRRHLGLHHPDRYVVQTVVETRFFGSDEQLVHDLVDLLSGQPLPAERAENALCGAVRTLSQDRVAVVILDDVEPDSPILPMVRRWLERREAEHRALFVLVSREPLDGFPCLRVGALPRSRWPDLVRSLLPLEAVLARILENRSAGNPKAAVQILGSWIDAGLAHTPGEGFGFPDGKLPPTETSDWVSLRIERLLREQPSWRVPLQLASLRDPVEIAHWERACDALDTPAPPALLHTLLARGLAEHTPDGFSFTDANIRSYLQQDATPDLSRLHGAWADVLPEQAEKAEHLLAAERTDEAVDALWVAARAAEERDIAEARRLLRLRHDALSTPGDPRRVEGMCQLALLAGNYGDREASRRWAALAVQEASSPRLAALARLRHGVAALRLNIPDGWADLEEAAQRFAALGEADLQGQALRAMARFQEDRHVRLQLLDEVLALPTLEPTTRLATLLDRAVVLAELGHAPEALEIVHAHIEEARTGWNCWGFTWYALYGVAFHLALDQFDRAEELCALVPADAPRFFDVVRGTLAFLAGDLENAERHFARSTPYDGGLGPLVLAVARQDRSQADALRNFVEDPPRIPAITRHLLRWLASHGDDPELRSWAAARARPYEPTPPVD